MFCQTKIYILHNSRSFTVLDTRWESESFPFEFDKALKSPESVMPDPIRHPEAIEVTGFWLGRHPGQRSGTE
jgi:hypothetical protein